MQGMQKEERRGVAIYVEFFFLSITQQVDSFLPSLNKL